VRIASLNLRAMPNRDFTKLEPLAALLASFDPDVVLLQECRAGWLEFVCAQSGLSGVRSHDLLDGVEGLPADGTAVAVRAPLQIDTATTLSAEQFAPAAVHALVGPDTPSGYEQLPAALLGRFRSRSLLAEITGAGPRFAACSFHATPGTGHYGPKPGKAVDKYKSFFHGGVAVALLGLEIPFIFAIDANEPRSETSTASHSTASTVASAPGRSVRYWAWNRLIGHVTYSAST